MRVMLIFDHSLRFFFFQVLFGIFVTRKIFPPVVVVRHRQGKKKGPICSMAGFRPFTVSLSPDYIFYPFIILHIVAGLQL